MRAKMRYFTTLEAARRLGISISKLQRAIWLGKIDKPERGPGGAYLWDEAALDRASWQLLGRSYEYEGATDEH